MIPIARTEKLLIQKLDDELVIYDRQQQSAHCLNKLVATVWHHSNGQNTVRDIAKLLEEELGRSASDDMEELVWLALEELERCHLLKEYVSQPTAFAGISRRKALKTAALTGGFALGSLSPVITSMIAPTPAMASSRPKDKDKDKDEDKDKKK